ncbi:MULTISPECIES: OmpA family protein [Methylosinus]|uniref:OmpA-like domain-containing protein n=1 Tax=Methylosinus trichosporium (strain ATCC 35070 / NCIMB 11131 / UNIQEM 75 / OB3b) TaxID=595536 RepID=A0A2D2D3W4_METT3|nr:MULTISPECIES: OmpA family protein [Methylosinus]ATQ69700.1 hypothetical protein CQW49_18785 [Methylosinus trichosporium OB3b]OBS51214.1 hypothetical protein A8B73_17310 [Methylosinus sp. 3S-1]
MIDLLTHYGLFAAIAFLLGALVAFASRGPAAAGGLLRRGDHTIAIWLCLALAVAQVTLGRISLYFDGALLLLAACLAGFGAVAAIFGPLARDRLTWRVGACGLAVTCALANLESARSLESDLRHRLGSLLARDGDDPLSFEVSGRDVLLPSETPGHATLAARLERAAGVRAVWTVDTLSPPAAALRERALAEAAARAAQDRAALAEWERRQAALPAPQERRSSSTGAPAARAPLVWAPPRDPTLPSTATLEPEPKASEPAEPPACMAALATLADGRAIRFARASAALDSESQQLLTRFAEQLKQCPQAALEIRGAADTLGKAAKNRRLSLRRSRAVADYLGRMGVGRDRLVNAEARSPARAENRIEFGVR